VIDVEGTPQPRRITVGINNNATAQVLSGLKAGERVVVGEASELTADNSPNARRRPMRMF
jgi:macrolide-specific efflux system membrane fusion protein